MRTVKRLRNWLDIRNRSRRNMVAVTLQEVWTALWIQGSEEAAGMDIIN